MATILAPGEVVMTVVVVVVANNQTEESYTGELHRGFILAQILVQPCKELTNEWWRQATIVLPEPSNVLQHPPCTVLQQGVQKTLI